VFSKRQPCCLSAVANSFRTVLHFKNFALEFVAAIFKDLFVRLSSVSRLSRGSIEPFAQRLPPNVWFSELTFVDSPPGPLDRGVPFFDDTSSKEIANQRPIRIKANINCFNRHELGINMWSSPHLRATSTRLNYHFTHTDFQVFDQQ
jgi:hypothetical protein